jgi:Glycosyl transferase family 2
VPAPDGTTQESSRRYTPRGAKQQLADTDHDPIVSVVIPAFNAARTLQETLTSVSQQTYRALDIVVVDDGSTDETAALVRDHIRVDPRVRLVQKPNGGIASARNAGIVVRYLALVNRAISQSTSAPAAGACISSSGTDRAGPPFAADNAKRALSRALQSPTPRAMHS